MAKKRTTLPKDLEELLSKAPLEDLIAIFTKCEVDARGGYGKQTALAFNNCPHELATWLVKNGADLHATDTWGNTPLHNRSGSRLGNIKSLLELGAEVNYKNNSGETPLHSAANYHNTENTALLLKYGARIDVINSNGQTPLEHALLTCRNIDIANTVEISRLYLSAGVKITLELKAKVAEIGKQFEFHKANFNKDSVAEVSEALEALYKVFGVEPVAKRIIHDGSSPIIVQTKTWQEQHEELWALLVQSSGPANTIQGEVIRITGRIANELDGNGGVNWDNDYRKMASAFLVFVKQGKSLPDLDLSEVAEIVKEVKQLSDGPARLCELAVKWVIDNPDPLKLGNVEYKR